uniref:Cytochrome P450 monooxygenase-like protein n=1 Tax=Adineta vaga TaxID=104782 RepID=B3G4M4_ADIVA|nr:cytochrome P450 monooxygenase-like protein [Adineta vaga]
MIILLNHMRENYLINAAHIFDIEILRSLIIINDGSITDSSHSSSTLSNLNDNSTQTLQESMIDIHNHSNYLWLFFIFQLFIFVFYHYWLQICLISFIIYSIYYISMLFIQQISKRGEWYSSLNNNEQKVLGTNYKSLFGDLSSIQSSQNGYFLNDLHNQLGSPQAYRIWMGPEPALMLAHPQAVKDFWGQHNEKCVERNVSLGWPLEMLMGNGVGFRSLPDRNRITKYFHQCFGASQVRHFDTQLELTVSKFFNNYSSEFLQYQNIRYFAHDVSVHLFLGKIGFDYLNELHELVDELGHLMNEAFNGRWTNLPLIGYYLLPSSYPLRKRIRLFNTRTRNVLMKIINIYQQTSMVNNGDDTITNNNISLLEYFAHDLKPTITFDELTDTIIEGLLAPNDGTAGTFMYTLLLLGMHPNIQETARQEIQSLTDLSLKSLSTTTYLDQILSECQRLCPIFMFNVPEFSSKSMIISGIQIPKNTMVMLDVISLNHNQDTWSDPLTFRPERFMTPVLPATLKAYHGFGNGHIRRCLGQYVIKNLHRLFLAHLLNQKQILLIDQIKNIHDIKRCRLPFIYIPTQSVRLVQL